MMSEVPERFLALVIPSADAVVPDVKGVAELVHLMDGGSIPHSNHSLTTSSEHDSFVLRMRSSCCEKWTCMASQCNVRFYISIRFCIGLVNTLQTPQLDSAVF